MRVAAVFLLALLPAIPPALLAQTETVADRHRFGVTVVGMRISPEANDAAVVGGSRTGVRANEDVTETGIGLAYRFRKGRAALHLGLDRFVNTDSDKDGLSTLDALGLWVSDKGRYEVFIGGGVSMLRVAPVVTQTLSDGAIRRSVLDEATHRGLKLAGGLMRELPRRGELLLQAEYVRYGEEIYTGSIAGARVHFPAEYDAFSLRLGYLF